MHQRATRDESSGRWAGGAQARRRVAAALGLALALATGGAADHAAAQAAWNVSITDGRDVPETGDLKLYVSVTDAGGQAVTGLDADAFTVHVTPDGGAAEQVEDFTVQTAAEAEEDEGEVSRPMAIALAFDKSDSMRAMGAFEPAKAAAAEFIDSRPPEDQIALYAFDEQVTLLQDYTTDRALLKSKLTELATGGGTALFEAIHTAAGAVRGRPERRAFVVFTDGHNDTALPRSEDEAIEASRDAEAPGYMLGFGNPQRETLRRVADASGGRFIERPATDDVRGVFQDLDRLLANQYVLTYAPDEDIEAGGYSVEVVVRTADGEGRDTGFVELAGDREPGAREEASGDDGFDLSSLAVLAAAAVFVASLVGLGWLLLGRRGAAAATCPRCGRVMDPSWARCLFCQHADAAAQSPASQPGQPPAGTRAAWSGSPAASADPSAAPTVGPPASHMPAAPPHTPAAPPHTPAAPRPTVRMPAVDRPTVALRRDQAWLTIVKGPGSGQRFALTDDVSIGRAVGNTILIEDPTVSRQHARILRRGSDHVLQNLSQSTPTRVNGAPGDGRVLQPGDRVALGAVELAFSRGPAGSA